MNLFRGPAFRWLALTAVLCSHLHSQTVEPVALGRKLFFDGRLSADGSVSCGTCHDPKRAFADDRTLSVGIFSRSGPRHVPSLVGRAFGFSQFWDGRVMTLEEQVLEPIRNPKEMDMTVERVLERLSSDAAYPGLTEKSLAGALASYVRTIRSTGSPYDGFLSGSTPGLTEAEREGLRLFRDKARCYVCHSGDQLTDESFHNTGVAWRGGSLLDEGRAQVTGKAYHRGAFKTPTLREIARTPPYMHDGSIATLEEVIEFYDRGGNSNPYLDENIVPLRLSRSEKNAVLAFLRALSGSIREGL
jgi:cytochrome c peroxidase